MKSISPREFAALEDAHLIDVREPDELEVVRVATAVPMPMSTIVDHLGELPDDPLYLLCHSGARSGQVAAYLEQRGYDATNVTGGIVEWEAEGLPVIR